MEHADWHPSHFDPDPSEKVADTTAQDLGTTSWHMLLPSSNVVIPDMLTVGIKLQATVQTNDDRR